MRILVQRIQKARIAIEGKVIAEVGPGLCIFLGVRKGDTERNVDYLAGKIKELRIFEDRQEKMNRSVTEIGGEILVVSEFTLYGDCTKGRRPSFSLAASAKEAELLYNDFVGKLRASGLKVSTGRFQAKMNVTLDNDGPVTFLIED